MSNSNPNQRQPGESRDAFVKRRKAQNRWLRLRLRGRVFHFSREVRYPATPGLPAVLTPGHTYRRGDHE